MHCNIVTVRDIPELIYLYLLVALYYSARVYFKHMSKWSKYTITTLMLLL